MAKRPLVPTAARAHLGEVRESSEFNDMGAAAQDLSYVPGYSDIRRERDRAMAEGRKPRPLRFRLQLVRVKNSAGAPDSRMGAYWRAKGYKEVQGSEMEGMGIAMPVGGMMSAEGFVDVGDTRLFVCDAERAARNERDWRRATDDLQATDSAPALEAEGRKFAKPGEDLTFAEGSYSDDQG
jgi:hypothetical protein